MTWTHRGIGAVMLFLLTGLERGSELTSVGISVRWNSVGNMIFNGINLRMTSMNFSAKKT